MAAKKRGSPRGGTRALGGWRVTATSTTATGTRRGVRAAGAAVDPFVQRLLASEQVELVEVLEAEPTPAARGAETETTPLILEATATDDVVAVVRHPSGAISFHAPDQVVERRGATSRAKAGPRTVRFRIDVTLVTPEELDPSLGAARRGPIGKIVKVVIVKVVSAVAGKVVDFVLEKLAEKWEASRWKKSGRSLGWLRVTPGSISPGPLPPLTDAKAFGTGAARNLLLLHGTFSSAEGAYGDLASTRGSDGRTFFEALAPTYGDRIFAFNHFSVSESPLENARKLVDMLPAGGVTFDVVTHSRGALVLRSLVEQRAELGAKADRFTLGHAVLVAGPNEGTPLASTSRWELFTSWLANIIDMFPDNPFTFGLEFITEALAWIAKKATGVLPGIASMNPEGRVIGALQRPPGPPAITLSALASNHEPDAKVLARMIDLGIDAFFGGANDLVVPTEGGWRVDAPGAVIPANRIGCFGNGGNIARPGNMQVTHLNFFEQAETVDFMVRALQGQAQPLAPLDPATRLPALRRTRGVLSAGTAMPVDAPPLPAPAVPAATLESARRAATSQPVRRPSDERPLDEVFHLFVLDPTHTSNGDGLLMAGRGGRRDPKQMPRPPVKRKTARRVAANAAANGDHEPAETDTQQVPLIIASFRNARVVEQFRLRHGDAGERWRQIIAMKERIERYIDGKDVEGGMPKAGELVTYGENLFRTLFPGDVRRLYDAARAEIGLQRRMDVVFTSTIGWVADKPWEFAYDPSRRMPLCLEEVNFIRNVLTAVPADALPPDEGVLRILVVAAQPIGAAPLSVEEEKAVILRGFQPLVDAGLAKVEVLPRATPGSLHARLESPMTDNDRIDVLHFIGHGEFDVVEQMGYLLFENDRGAEERLRADVFRQIVAKRGVRLVFLNACETGLGLGGGGKRSVQRTDFAAGVAPMLVRGGVPTVVANQFKVLDPAAVTFARHFYWALSDGRCVGDAAREARVAVNYSVTGESIDWAVPVIFARNPGDRLVRGMSGWPKAIDVLGRHVGVRRGARRDQVRVAIWDVNHVAPHLARIVARLNAVQQRFVFEVADISAPIGTWRLRPSPNGDDGETGMALLDANEVTEKLLDTPARLGVDRLLCITSFPLRGDGIDELYAYMSPDGRIDIISTADLIDQLDPPHTTLDRMITNLIVGLLSDLESHETEGRKRKDCPAYYNDDREIEFIAGPLKFCSCARHMDPDARKSLDEILDAFHAG